MKTVYAVVRVQQNPGEAVGFGKVRLVAGDTNGTDVKYSVPPFESIIFAPLVRMGDRDASLFEPDWFDTPAEAVVAYAKDRMRFVADHNAHVAEQLGSLSRQMTEMGVAS